MEDSGQRKGVSIRKGGGRLREEEMDYWMQQFGAEEDVEFEENGPQDAPPAEEGDFEDWESEADRPRSAHRGGHNPAPKRRRGNGQRGVDEDLARWLGVSEDDDRIYGDDDDEEFDSPSK